MAYLYFYCFLALATGLLLPVFRKPARIFEYPQFMAAVFVVFIAPQMVSLLRFPGEASPGAVSSVLLMSCLCLGMCALGYRAGLAPRILRRLTGPVNPARLFLGGMVFVVCGFFFDFLIDRMTDEERGGSTWTGIVTIYGFFAGLIYPGFAICLMTALRRRHQLFPWVATAIAAVPPIESAIFAGRREATTQFALTVLLTLFYLKRWAPPRWFIVGAIALATLAIPATGTYRTIAALGAWSYLPQFDLVANFNEFVNSESILELRNGAMMIEATKQTGSYEFGTAYWDQLVFRFVPAQIVGAGVKQSLMFHTAEERAAEEEMSQQFGYEVAGGSTLTGMGDVFRQFGYLGCLFFGAMGVLFRTLYTTSLRADATFAKLFYIQIATSAMRAVTHETVDFLPGVFYNVIFLGLLMAYAGEKPTLPGRSQPAKRVFSPGQSARVA